MERIVRIESNDLTQKLSSIPHENDDRHKRLADCSVHRATARERDRDWGIIQDALKIQDTKEVTKEAATPQTMEIARDSWRSLGIIFVHPKRPLAYSPLLTLQLFIFFKNENYDFTS